MNTTTSAKDCTYLTPTLRRHHARGSCMASGGTDSLETPRDVVQALPSACGQTRPGHRHEGRRFVHEFSSDGPYDECGVRTDRTDNE